VHYHRGRMPRAVRLAAIVTVIALATASAHAAPPRPIAVVAIDPGVALTDAQAAARAAGFAPVVMTLPPGEDASALAAIEADLDAARAAWLGQRRAEMVAILDGLVGRALPILARSEQRAALWQLAFLRGLAGLGEATPEAATPWFGLALEIEPNRRPEPGTYPPAVDGGFAVAVEEQGRRIARAVALDVTPADARIVIDGVPVLDRARPRQLRRGLHAILVEAPGFVADARLIEVGDQPLTIALAPSGEPPVAVLAAWLARGSLDLDAPSTQAVVLAAARAVGAEAALVVGARGARLIARARVTAWHPEAAAALAPPAATSLPAPPPARRRWWLWGGVTIGVAAAAVATVWLVTRDAPADRTQLGFAP
jgi:hypothetical protein